MGSEDRPEDWTRTVRENHPDAIAWVVASSEPCLTVRDQETEHVERVLKGEDFGNLPDQDTLPDSWLVAVIVCPGDDLQPIIDWTQELDPVDRERVQFYHHPDVEVQHITGPWLEAGLPMPYTAEVEDFSSFHNRFGWEFNDRVYRDATGWEPP